MTALAHHGNALGRVVWVGGQRPVVSCTSTVDNSYLHVLVLLCVPQVWCIAARVDKNHDQQKSCGDICYNVCATISFTFMSCLNAL